MKWTDIVGFLTLIAVICLVLWGFVTKIDQTSRSIRAHQSAQINECRDRGGMPIKDNDGNLINCSFPPWKAQ